MPSKTTLQVTVCQLCSDAEKLEADWERLATHVRETKSDLVLLPEMPFYPWPFWQEAFQPDVWQASLAAHDTWEKRLAELAPAVIVGSRPVTEGEKRLNRGFMWSAATADSMHLSHSKFYLPDESGFWEGSWYERGDGAFEPQVIGIGDDKTVRAGFLICTELWFTQAARAYGQAGAELLLTPRATERRTVDKWLAGGRVAAVVAGAYSLSSNHYREGEDPGRLGGLGWIIGPDGEVLALTTPANPFVTMPVVLERARRAKETYPRYVAD